MALRSVNESLTLKRVNLNIYLNDFNNFFVQLAPLFELQFGFSFQISFSEWFSKLSPSQSDTTIFLSLTNILKR